MNVVRGVDGGGETVHMSHHVGSEWDSGEVVDRYDCQFNSGSR